MKNKKQEYCLAFFLNGQQELLLKKTITIGENGIINIDLENNSFEYEYNNYKIKNNIKNIYSYIFAYAILTYLGYDINNIIKKC